MNCLKHRLFPALLALTMLLSLAACGGGTSAPSGTQTQDTPAVDASPWQEQYDLGLRFLSEGDYEAAILAFTAAIEIDPMQADAYVGLAKVYVTQGDNAKAEEILAQAEVTVGQNDALTTAWKELLGITGWKRTDQEDGSYRISYYDADGNRYHIYYREGLTQTWCDDADGRLIYERYAHEDDDRAIQYDYDGTQVIVTATTYRSPVWSEDASFPITASCTYTMGDPSHTVSAYGEEHGRGDELYFDSIRIDEYTAEDERYAEAEICTDSDPNSDKSDWKCTYSGTEVTYEVTAWSRDRTKQDTKVLHHTMQSPENTVRPGYAGGAGLYFGGGYGVADIMLRELDTDNNIIYEETFSYPPLTD